MKNFEFTEKDVSAATGISARMLEEIRHKQMVNGGHWLKDSTGVRYSEYGVKRLMDIAEISGEKMPPHDEPAEPLEPPEEADLLVTRFYTNPQILGAVRAVGEPVQRVRVKTTKNFRRGMKIPCTHLQADLWILTGRCPRWPGKF